DDLADDDSARTVWHFGGERRSPAQIVAALQPLARRAQAQRDAIGDAAITYRSAPPAARALDAISIADWLDATGVGGWPRALIDTAYTAEYGVELERQSALNLVTALDPQPDASGVTGTSDERYRIRGGNDRIAAALGERLAGAIEPEAVLEALRQRRDGRYLCSFRRDGASTDVEAAQVVLAIPFTLLRQVRLDVELPAAKSRAIATLGYGTNAKLVIPFAQRHWRIAHGASGTVLTDGPLQLVWDAMRRQPGAAGALTQYLGGRRGVALGSGAPHAHARDAIGELDSIFGGIAAHADAARAVRMHWPTQRWALGSYSCYLPGQWCAVRGAEGEAVEGLFFAGEHCSLDAQGFIEGACSSGEDAARQVLASRVRAARARAPTGPGPFRAAPSTPSFRASSSPARLSASSSSRTASARTATASG
ncbi:MAG TPA: FAD-dependent oxidoreductase, partial [Burkholderiaceae bacterium]|nr:FAD-dependent oxidoreductase [Burkholderiaceae bacterium]